MRNRFTRLGSKGILEPAETFLKKFPIQGHEKIFKIKKVFKTRPDCSTGGKFLNVSVEFDE